MTICQGGVQANTPGVLGCQGWRSTRSPGCPAGDVKSRASTAISRPKNLAATSFNTFAGICQQFIPAHFVIVGGLPHYADGKLNPMCDGHCVLVIYISIYTHIYIYICLKHIYILFIVLSGMFHICSSEGWKAPSCSQPTLLPGVLPSCWKLPVGSWMHRGRAGRSEAVIIYLLMFTRAHERPYVTASQVPSHN